MPECSDCTDESDGPCNRCHREYCDGCYDDHTCTNFVSKRMRA